MSDGKRMAKTPVTRLKTDDLVLGGEPRVELLPPEVGLRVKARAMRRVGVLLLVLALAAVGGGYAFAFFRSTLAQADLAAAQDETQALLVEQQKYSEASLTASLVDGVEQAQTLGATTEVLWSDLISSVRATLPPGVQIESATLTGRAPWETELLPTGPLRAPRVATALLVITSPTIFDATTIVRGLAGIPGFADATPDSITVSGETYSTTITLNVNEEALSKRFADKAANTEVSG